MYYGCQRGRKNTPQQQKIFYLHFFCIPFDECLFFPAFQYACMYACIFFVCYADLMLIIRYRNLQVRIDYRRYLNLHFINTFSVDYGFRYFVCLFVCLGQQRACVLVLLSVLAPPVPVVVFDWTAFCSACVSLVRLSVAALVNTFKESFMTQFDTKTTNCYGTQVCF